MVGQKIEWMRRMSAFWLKNTVGIAGGKAWWPTDSTKNWTICRTTKACATTSGRCSADTPTGGSRQSQAGRAGACSRSHDGVAGLPNKTIAYDLDINPRTIEVHRANVMSKMQAKNLPELMRMVLAADLGPG